MFVKTIHSKNLDLSKSLLNEDADYSDRGSLKGEVIVTGAVVLDESMRIMPLISSFLTLALKYNDIADGSSQTLGKNLGYFMDYLKLHKHYKHYEYDSALLHVQTHTIKEYLAHLKTEGISSATIRNRDASIQSLFTKHLCVSKGNSSGLRKDNPYKGGLLSASPGDNIIEMCNRDELIALIRCAQHERERVLLQFMFDSGLRRSEIPRVKQSDILGALNANRESLIVDDDTIYIPSNYAALDVTGSKGKKREFKPRTTIVSKETLLRVTRYHSSPLYRKYGRKFGSNKPAFLNAKGEAYKASSISKLLERLSNRALKNNLIKRSISPHMLRHGFAGEVLRSEDLGNNKLDRLIVVQRCLGHSSLKTTQTYTKLPFDIYGSIVDKEGNNLKRYQIMEKIWDLTKKVISLDAKM